jgi:poly(hydroxyalkanoate) depolymerase family esterase
MTPITSADALAYELYQPPQASGDPSALVVMLHGSDLPQRDFAVATGMNELAREQGFLVLYPELGMPSAPGSEWHWFELGAEERGRGESAQIAQLTLQIAARHQVDRDRIYIAGQSAGAAMAASVAASYPELYAAVGAHPGMPGRVAINLAEALAVQRQSNDEGPSLLARLSRADLAPSADVDTAVPVPTIVFHPESASQRPEVGDPPATERRRYRGSARPAAFEQPPSALSGEPAEYSLVHGNGPAWANGEPNDGSRSGAPAHGGSVGVSVAASAEMLRFFFAQPGPLRV